MAKSKARRGGTTNARRALPQPSRPQAVSRFSVRGAGIERSPRVFFNRRAYKVARQEQRRSVNVEVPKRFEGPRVLARASGFSSFQRRVLRASRFAGVLSVAQRGLLRQGAVRQIGVRDHDRGALSRVGVCVGRRIRREVLFALGVGGLRGLGGGRGVPRSRVKC